MFENWGYLLGIFAVFEKSLLFFFLKNLFLK